MAEVSDTLENGRAPLHDLNHSCSNALEPHIYMKYIQPNQLPKMTTQAARPGRVTKKTPQKRTPKDVPRLVVKQTAISIEDELEDHGADDIVRMMKRVLSTQWSGVPDQLSTDFKEHIIKYRQFLPNLVSRSHLYSLFLDQQSMVDKQVANLLKERQLVRVQTQNSQLKGDLLITMEDYTAFINTQVPTSQHPLLLKKFKEYTINTDTSSMIPKTQLLQTFTSQEIITLQQLDYISLVLGDMDHVLISMPRFGFIVSLYTRAKQFIIRVLSTNKWKESTHAVLIEKWEKNKTRFKDFKGLHLQWCLHYLIGEGVIEAFETFDDKAFKLVN